MTLLRRGCCRLGGRLGLLSRRLLRQLREHAAREAADRERRVRWHADRGMLRCERALTDSRSCRAAGRRLQAQAQEQEASRAQRQAPVAVAPHLAPEASEAPTALPQPVLAAAVDLAARQQQQQRQAQAAAAALAARQRQAPADEAALAARRQRQAQAGEAAPMGRKRPALAGAAPRAPAAAARPR